MALSTVNGQVSTLVVLFQHPLASVSLLRTFIQWITCVLSLIRPLLPLSDLNLVLSIFFSLDVSSFWQLLWRIGYLSVALPPRGLLRIACSSAPP